MSDKPDFGEPWRESSGRLWDRDGGPIFIGYVKGARIAECVSACAGMSDPAAEIAALRQALAASEASRARLVAWLKAKDARARAEAEFRNNCNDDRMLRDVLTAQNNERKAEIAITPADIAIVSQSAESETQPGQCLTGEKQA